MSQGVKIGFKVQGALGTAAVGAVDYVLHTRFTENVGRVTDRGEFEIGAGLAVNPSGAIYGMNPVGTGTGRARVPDIGPLLLMAGRAVSVGVYTPVATAAAYPYFSAAIDYITHQKIFIDCKINRLVFNFVPRRAPTFEFTLVGLNQSTPSPALTWAAVAGSKMLTPAATITSAQANIAGVTGTKFYSFQYIIENVNLTDRVPIGQMAADDNLTVGMRTRCVVLLANTASNYEKFVYGAAAATAPTADYATGALNVRINTGGATPNYINMAWTTAEWSTEQEIVTTPTGQELIAVTGYALTGVTETIL
jgi:hypothetical protein